MSTTRREFIRRFGIVLASLLAARCVPASPDPTATPTTTPKPTATPTPTPNPPGTLPDLSAQCEAWTQARSDLTSQFRRIYRDSNERARIRAFNRQYVLDSITSDPDFRKLFEIRYWLIENRVAIIPDLIDLLDDSTEVGLENSADLIILERIDAGDLVFYGHGWIVQDDLFQVSGRASWLLKEATGLDFDSVSMHSSADDLDELQRRWDFWYAQFECK